MASYTRQSTFSDGDLITAALFNNEYNQLVDAFDNVTGHKHDGTLGEGPVIGVIGDAGLAIPLNKILVDTTNDHIEFYIDVSGTSTQQLYIADGAIVPTTNNDVDLGTNSLQFKNLYIDGTANIDSLVADTADINGGTIDGVTIGGSSTGAITGTTITATNFVIGSASINETELEILDGATLTTTELNYVDGVTSSIQTQIDTKAPLASPSLTGIPTAPTAASNTNTTQIATTAYVQTEITDLIDAAPGTLDTLNELAAAINDDANYNTTLTTALATKLPLAGGTMTGDVTYSDNVKAQFGTSQDLQIYHDGSNSYIKDAGIGNLQIQATGSTFIKSSDGTKISAQFAPDSYTRLYYNNAIKLQTTSTGIDVTGRATTDGLTSEGTLGNWEIQDNGYIQTFSRAGVNYIRANNASGSLRFDTGGTTIRQKIASNGDISFYDDTGTNENLKWDASADTLNFVDNAKATFGASNDLQIYHDGTHSYVQDVGTGNLILKGGADVIIRAASNDSDMIRANVEDSVQLYHNGQEKLETTSTGIDVTGTVVSDGATIAGTLELDSNNLDHTAATPQYTMIESDVTGNNTQFLQTAGDLRIRTVDDSKANPVERLRIDHSTGDISFYDDTGTTQGLFWDASAENLFVGGTSTTNAQGWGRQISSINSGTNGAALTLKDSNGEYQLASYANNFYLSQGANTRFFINSSGSVGIGTTSPARKLTVQGGSGDNLPVRIIGGSGTTKGHIEFQDASTTADYKVTIGSVGDNLTLQAGGSERARIDSSGNLLVGKTSASTATVGVEAQPIGLIKATRNGSQAITLNRLTSDGDIAVFKKDGTDVGSIGTQSARLTIGTGDTGLRFVADANEITPWNLTTNGVSNGLLDLGNTNNKFKDLHLSGTANFGSLSDGTITITGFVDEDNMSSNSATLVPTQQSVKAYVDSQVSSAGGNGISFSDNEKAQFGDGNDLQIYHDGSNSYINDLGDGFLKIGGASQVEITNNTNTEQMAVFKKNGAVELYYDNAEKLATTSTGIDVTGTVTSDGLTVDGETFSSNGTYGTKLTYSNGNQSGVIDTFGNHNLEFRANNDRAMNIAANGDISFYDDTGTSENLKWDASADTLNFVDGAKAQFGAGNDLQIYHTGSHSYIDSYTGNLYINSDSLQLTSKTGGENYIRAFLNGAVDIYYDNAVKLATTSTGITVTGSITTDGMTTSADINFGDDDKALFGASNDLKIYHSANNQSYIHEVGTGDLNILATNLKLQDAGGSTKVLVNSTGINVTGTVTSDGLTVDGTIDVNTTSITGIAIDSTNNGSQISFESIVSSVPWNVGISGDTTEDFVVYQSGSGSGAIKLYTDGDTRLQIANNGDISFYEDTGTTQALFWDASAESLGIGTTSPSATLDISDSFGAINLESSTGTNQVQVKVLNTGGSAFFGRDNNAGSWFGTGEAYATTLRSDGAYPMIFRVNGGNRLVLDDGGNVGIGTSSPNAKLDVSSATGSATITPTELLISSSTQASDWSLTEPWGVLGFYSADTSGGGAGNLAEISANMENTVGGFASLDFKLQNSAQSYAKTSWLTLKNSSSLATRQVLIEADGGLYVENNVGIGTTNPAKQLHVYQPSGQTGIVLSRANNIAGVNLQFSVDSSKTRLLSYGDALSFWTAATGSGTNASEKARIDSSGNVGIGISNPSDYWGQADNLVVGGTGNDGITIKSSTTGNGRLVFTDTASSTAGLNDGGQIQYNHVSDYMTLRTNGAEQVRIDSSGNVGIGVDAPISKVQVNSSTFPQVRINETTSGGESGIRFRSTNGSTVDFHGDIFVDGTGSETGRMGFRVPYNSSEKMTILSSGLVGINTNNPSQPLHVDASGGGVVRVTRLGTSASAYGQLEHDGTNTTLTSSAQLIFNSGGSESARLDASGNVGIGTTSPVTPLHVSTAKSSVTDSVLTLQDTTETFGKMIEFVGQGSTDCRGVIGFQEPQNNAPELYIANGGTESAGNGVGLAFWSYITVNRIIPCDNLGALRDNAIDLGSSSARFDDIYATNGTIQTSDRNDKQDIQALTDAETRVATACKGLLRRFRWQDAVTEKGDEARYHFGIISQDLQDAFTAEGLDAGDYGMFISQTWEDSDGVEQTRLGVRYSELLAFIIAAI